MTHSWSRAVSFPSEIADCVAEGHGLLGLAAYVVVTSSVGSVRVATGASDVVWVTFL